jgi:hypothetical protein
MAAVAGSASALVELDPDGLVHVSTATATDSITVGERFAVQHTITFPDTLTFLEPTEVNTGNCRVLRSNWVNAAPADGHIARTLDLTLITLDLEAARIPPMAFDFQTPSGDTLRAIATDIEMPVRSLASQSTDLAPLKEQWEAPRSYLAWIVAAAAVAALAALAWWWWRRRRQRQVEPERPRLPADYLALSELNRIERMGLLDEGQHKRYYTLVVDVVRHYLEERFGVDTMDRTTHELMDEFERRRIHIDDLWPLLEQADLVKFARSVPQVAEGQAAMETARDIVVSTTPRNEPGGDTLEEAA